MEQHHWAGIISFLFGVAGVTVNSTAILLLRKAKSLANPFRILTINQSITALINCSIATFFIAPTIFFSLHPSFEASARVGKLFIVAYDCCSWSHLLITLNRFTFIFFPFRYADIFSRSRTLFASMTIWIVAIGINYYEFDIVDCHYTMTSGSWSFDFTGSDCDSVEWYLNYCRDMILTGCIALIDVLTIIKFRSYSKIEGSSSNSSKRQRQEFLLLIQAVLQSGLFYTELVCCYNLGALSVMNSRWAQFGLRTVAWVVTLAADGGNDNTSWHLLRASVMAEHHWAGIIIFLLGACGVTFNSTVIIFLKKAKSLANPFRILTVNQAVTDLINSTVFTFIIAPTVFFSLALPFEVTARLGQLLFLAYDCCSWSHLMITLNRFTFTFFPFDYAEVFTRFSTLLYVLLIWALAVCINFYEYAYIDCHFFLPVGAWNFDFKGGAECKVVEWYLNYCRNMILTACIACLDIATVIKFHSYSKIQNTSSIGNKWRMQRQEVFLLAQAMLQSTIFYIELVCCYNIGALPFMASPWAQFGLRTVAWVTTHAADGLITLLCNGDFRRMLYRKLFLSGDQVKKLNSSKLTLSINFPIEMAGEPRAGSARIVKSAPNRMTT